MSAEIVLTQDQKDELNRLAKKYNESLSTYKSYEAQKNADNLVLKSVMSAYGVSKYMSDDGVKISVSTRPNISWKEDDLLDYCKTLDIDGLVKTKEYVDMQALEDAIYRNEINPENLKKFQIVKPDIVVLKCEQKEKLNE